MQRTIKSHTLFWMLYIAFTVGIYNVQEPALGLHLTYELLSLPAKMLMVYVTLYYILPRYLLAKKYVAAAGLLLVTLLASIWLLHISISFVLYPIYYPESISTIFPVNLPKLVSPLLDLIIVSSLAVVIKLLEVREEQKKAQIQLEKTNARNELQLLKSQLQPHFLFNTLNGLYACIEEDPKQASNMVLQLSDILRYIIYEGNEQTVSLKEDIDCLMNYVDLEKIRYGDRLDLQFTVRGEVSGKNVAPLHLLPFVENAFKHGPSKNHGENWILAEIEVEEHRVTLRISNSKVTNQQEGDQQGGIGLQNAKQRLTFSYGDSYQLDLEDQANRFNVLLKIPVA